MTITSVQVQQLLETTSTKTKPKSIQPRPAGVVIPIDEKVTETTVQEKLNSVVSSQSNTTKSSSRNPTRTTSRRSSSTLRRSSSPLLLQRCLDDYTSQGSWDDQARWVGGGPSNIGGKNTNQTSSSVCPSFDHHVFPTKEDIATAWSNLTIGFMGDSTTRSDLRAWEEEFGCPRTNLYEASLFQKKHPKNRTHICKLHEQSINLDKCGIPPILNMTQCPSPPNPPNNENDDQSSVVSFRYWYKVYPWTPLDQWYLQSPQSELFEDLDVLVISIGRWFKYRRSQHINVTNEIDQFLVELQKVYTGVILFQSPYAKHTVPVTQSTCPVPCTHGLMNEKWQCEATITAPKPKDDEDLRSVVVHHQPHPIPYIDRWDISTALPIEYYHTWLCEKPKFHSWFCDHHLSFVAMEHFRMIARVVSALSSSS